MVVSNTQALQPVIKILIVDDVPENLALLHETLDASGCEVYVATNGESALHVVEKILPDAILLDVVMPGMDGFDVSRRLRENVLTRDLPVIFMTGLAETDDVVAGFAAGGTDYVTKPVRVGEVMARINAHVRRARQFCESCSVLDAMGQAVFVMNGLTGQIHWQTPMTRRFWRAEEEDIWRQQLLDWLLDNLADNEDGGNGAVALKLNWQNGYLVFNVIERTSSGDWMIGVREDNPQQMIDALLRTLRLTPREAEVLYWVMCGKTNRDISEVLGSSPRTVDKHLEHIFVKLDVETRTAAVSLALNRLGLMGTS